VSIKEPEKRKNRDKFDQLGSLFLEELKCPLENLMDEKSER
jgi:hypothetical protein